LFNPVRTVGELKFHFFLLNFIQDKTLKSKTEENRKKGGCDPEENKTVIFPVLFYKKSIGFSRSAMTVPRGTLQDYIKKVEKLNILLEVWTYVSFQPVTTHDKYLQRNKKKD
jgi:hypothetical protein